MFATVSASFQTGQPINEHCMPYCMFPSPFSSGFGRTGSSVFLPPVFPVKLWKGQMSSGGQFLHHLNTRNCVGCLQCTGGAGSKTQNDRLRSRHKGKEPWAELWWVPVLAASFTIYFHTCVFMCVGVHEEATPTHYLRSVCSCMFGSLWVYIHLHCGGLMFLCCCWSFVTAAWREERHSMVEAFNGSFCLSSHTPDYRSCTFQPVCTQPLSAMKKLK